MRKASGGGSRVDVTLWEPPRRLSKLGFWPLFTWSRSIEPSKTNFALLDLWLISLFSYSRHASEREYSILRFIRWGTGAGDLMEESGVTADGDGLDDGSGARSEGGR